MSDIKVKITAWIKSESETTYIVKLLQSNGLYKNVKQFLNYSDASAYAIKLRRELRNEK